ncbi:MAG: glycosyltransferase family 4 protein [Ignavibacteriales bacterium]|nr:glycosyltransferase family 4 protein [Ignavibacteriales bacterium]
MKVLYSCLSKSWGGMEMFTITAVRELLNRNIETELVCIKNSPIYMEAVKDKILTIPIKSFNYCNPIQIIKFSKIVGRRNYSLVHTQYSKDLWLFVPALKFAKSNIPLFLTKQMGSFIVKKDFLHKKLYNRVTKIFAISTVIKNNLIETCPVSEGKIIILHNAVDTKKFSPENGQREKIRTEFNIKGDEIAIGMLARFTPGKGHEEFLYAAKKLIEIYGNLKFMIVGDPSRGEDNYGLKIKELATTYNLSDKIIFTGFRTDTVDILSAMDIFAFPSHSEAFGIALVEAMSMALPSVCSDSDGILDIAVDNETSLLFENKNTDSLIEKLKLLIENNDMRSNLGLNARQRAIEHFDLKSLSDKVVDYYKTFSSKNQ